MSLSFSAFFFLSFSRTVIHRYILFSAISLYKVTEILEEKNMDPWKTDKKKKDVTRCERRGASDVLQVSVFVVLE